jgi:hypothetical protein
MKIYDRKEGPITEMISFKKKYGIYNMTARVTVLPFTMHWLQ